MSRMPTTAESAGSTNARTADAMTASDDRIAAVDARREAFFSPHALEVFHSVCQKDQIWKLDTLDVHDIHEHARLAFYNVLEGKLTASGHLLLMKGEAGSGKTHLMRHFRNHVHENGLGFCGYLQMTTATDNYGRYILANLIESLSDPYWELGGESSGLLELSNLMVEKTGVLSPQELERLRHEEMDNQQLAFCTLEFADRLVSTPGYERLDIDLIRALAYLQRHDPRLDSRVQKYLRCEPLNSFDRSYLPELEPRLHDHHPQETVERLGQMMAAVGGRRLVLLVDQLEEMTNFDDNPQFAETRFRRAMQALCGIVGAVPGSLGVIACLEDFYDELAKRLPKTTQDRIEQNPEPVRLDSRRSASEVRLIVKRRLDRLYAAAGVNHDDTLYPFPDEFLEKLSQMRTRDVLEHCRKFRDGGGKEIVIPPGDDDERAWESLAVLWNDHKPGAGRIVPESEEEQAELLGWAIEQCGLDLNPAVEFSVDREGREAVISGRLDSPGKKLRFAICNRGTQGGGLMKQLQAFLQRVGDYSPVIVRSAAYPKSEKSQVSTLLGDLVAKGGLRILCEDAHWRQLLAFQEFQQQHQHDPAFAEWRRRQRPLASLKPMIDLLGLDQDGAPNIAPGPTSATANTGATANNAAKRLTNNAAATRPTKVQKPVATPAAPSVTPTATPSVAPSVTPPVAPSVSPPVKLPTTTANEPFQLGLTSDFRKTPVLLEPKELTQHAAFLGGSGSGKTTLALNLIEQLALQGVPAILIDRKGDLCGYADPNSWRGEGDSEEMRARRMALRDRLDVVVYTPGEPRGNPLGISLIPSDMATLDEQEQETLAKVATESLAAMMGYKPSNAAHKTTCAVLQQAILLLGRELREPITVRHLTDYIGNQDSQLIQALGWIDAKLCRKLASDLQTVELSHRSLLSTTDATLDMTGLLGRDGSLPPGKTRLTVVSTKFLRDAAAAECWMAQFLMTVVRWMSRNPSDRLQCVLLFDEADVYLPAVRQPATKLPMENLLKRARSAGIGIMLATQTPGDLDYKCRENVRAWFLGRVKEETALKKLKAAFDNRSDLVQKLAGQGTGEFILLREGQATPFRSDRSVLVTRQLAENDIQQLAFDAKKHS